MRLGTDNTLGVPTVFLGTACVLGHRVPRAETGPWGHDVAEDNVEHGVRLAFVSYGLMCAAQRWRSPAAGSGSDAGADAGGSQVQRFVRWRVKGTDLA